MNYVLESFKVSGFIQKHRAAKNSYQLAADGCSAQAQASEYLNSHTPAVSPSYVIYSQM